MRRITQVRISDEELDLNKEHLVNKHRLALLGTFRYMRLLIEAELNQSINDFHSFTEKIEKN